MTTRIRLLIATAALALAAAALSPAASHAAVSCLYDGATHQMTVTMTSVGDNAKVGAAGDEIHVNNDLCPGSPTVTNTSAVVWNDTSNGATTATVDLTGGPMGPGLSPNAGDRSPTIPMTVKSGTGFDKFAVIGTPEADTIALGTGAVNSFVNLDWFIEGDFPDADVRLESVEDAVVDGNGGGDSLHADGARATGSAFDRAVTLNGGPGSDGLVGGSFESVLSGGDGSDVIFGGESTLATTFAFPGPGDDFAQAGDGKEDEVHYNDADGSVSVDLARNDAQNTGGAGVDTLRGFEEAAGSRFDDHLAGTNGSNKLTGRGGRDVLEGRGGDDLLFGNDSSFDTTGVDVVSYAHPSLGHLGVTVSLAAQGDFQDTGSEGHDWLAGVSDVIGSPFGDTITGDAQANRIDAGNGADSVSAGDGPDALLLRDGVGDTADCGGADDTVDSDTGGLDVLTGCEQGGLAPPAPLGDTPADATAAPAPLGDALAAGSVDRSLTFRFSAAARQRLGRRGTVKLSMVCPLEGCRARVAGTVVVRARTRGAAVRRFRGGSATVGLTAGKRRALAMRLLAKSARRARAALRQGDSVTVRVTAVARDAAGNRRTIRRSIALRS